MAVDLMHNAPCFQPVDSTGPRPLPSPSPYNEDEEVRLLERIDTH